MDAVALTQADPDFFRPLHRASNRGTEFRPSTVPADWSEVTGGIWTQWYPETELNGVEEGWKIHVSARIDRAAEVLDVAAAVFFRAGVPFKHLSCARFFLLSHFKHAPRQQSGKFCAAYPSDVDTARRVMDELTTVLRGEDGPSILTDRRYRDSAVVHYRYGSFADRRRILADGTHEMLVRDGAGCDTPDHRGASFVLPTGIVDPFTDPVRAADYLPVPDDFRPVFHGYAVNRVLRYSNSGGTYAGEELATGRPVFIKEARTHNGLSSWRTTAQDRLRAEYDTLRAVHDAAPGICPEPLAYFRLWEHEFLVTEFLAGQSAHHWTAENNPIFRTDPDAAAFAGYHRRAHTIVESLADQLRRLHDAGYVFFDLNPFNVLVADDRPRLVDFEFAGPAEGPQAVEPAGAPGHVPLDAPPFADRRRYDEYGLSALALYLVAPANNAAQRNPAVLDHVRHELDRRDAAAAAGPLWTMAYRRLGPAGGNPTSVRAGSWPDPQAVAADPVPHLRTLRDRMARGLAEVADADDPDDAFPLGPHAHRTNRLSVAHGLAGVVHALSVSGTALPPGVLDRLARDTFDRVAVLPPGLHIGLAGIAWVLAENDRVDEARDLLKYAADHPVLHGSGSDAATLGHGRAGVGMAHLYLFARTGDERHLDRATGLAAEIPPDRDLAPALGPDNAVGLLLGRAGVALFDYYIGQVTGEPDHLRRGLGRLHDELRQSVPDGTGTLFPVSGADRRLMPYLYAGSAGVAFVASRYLSTLDDPVLAAAMPGLLAAATVGYTTYGGLYSGMAGLGLVLADHAQRYDDADTQRHAECAAGRMFMYGIEYRSGVHLLGETSMRLSTDLSNGTAGALLFLDTFLERRRDTWFTLDALCRREPGEAPIDC